MSFMETSTGDELRPPITVVEDLGGAWALLGAHQGKELADIILSSLGQGDKRRLR
jgi:hypothetical protein